MTITEGQSSSQKFKDYVPLSDKIVHSKKNGQKEKRAFLQPLTVVSGKYKKVIGRAWFSAFLSFHNVTIQFSTPHDRYTIKLPKSAMWLAAHLMDKPHQRDFKRITLCNERFKDYIVHHWRSCHCQQDKDFFMYVKYAILTGTQADLIQRRAIRKAIMNGDLNHGTNKSEPTDNEY